MMELPQVIVVEKAVIAMMLTLAVGIGVGSCLGLGAHDDWERKQIEECTRTRCCSCTQSELMRCR
jgi:hypothetical protein